MAAGRRWLTKIIVVLECIVQANQKQTAGRWWPSCFSRRRGSLETRRYLVEYGVHRNHTRSSDQKVNEPGTKCFGTNGRRQVFKHLVIRSCYDTSPPI
ncbi:hypothetical protein F4813DRAFT_290939 [Daldinia decipiens]|uniref:uncharacterized protein n=1 Tax=Daldinia decipiens TaxID=326647 RepID=UPI0020C27C33|nr:uncharacterized protein F4813DRAFT_290939 [Daldinia decipiens]KAI1660306.1 hypothetical protein F4813DRAFT_290939 [Daldinia decipiens]